MSKRKGFVMSFNDARANHLEPQFVNICVDRIGKNGRGPHEGGRDYWLTVRGPTDRMHTRLVLIGMCYQGTAERRDGIFSVEYPVHGSFGNLPSSVRDHLIESLQAAYKAFDENEELIHGLEVEAADAETESNAWMLRKLWRHFLPESFTRLVEGDDGDRFFVCTARRKIGGLRATIEKDERVST
jgi:hypothetical protein